MDILNLPDIIKQQMERVYPEVPRTDLKMKQFYLVRDPNGALVVASFMMVNGVLKYHITDFSYKKMYDDPVQEGSKFFQLPETPEPKAKGGRRRVRKGKKSRKAKKQSRRTRRR